MALKDWKVIAKSNNPFYINYIQKETKEAIRVEHSTVRVKGIDWIVISGQKLEDSGGTINAHRVIFETNIKAKAMKYAKDYMRAH